MVALERTLRGAPSQSVAGSLFFLEYARRVSWPVLAVHLRENHWLDPDINDVYVRPDPAGRLLIGFGTDPVHEARSTQDVVDAIVEDHLRLMVDAVNVTTHTDRSVLWANAAAAMAGAFLALSWGSSDHSRYLDEATEAFAANAQLDGLVALTSFRLGGEDWFMSRRRRCCLAIRARASNRGEVYCASCPILSEDEQGRRYLDAAIRFQAVERVVSADGL